MTSPITISLPLVFFLACFSCGLGREWTSHWLAPNTCHDVADCDPSEALVNRFGFFLFRTTFNLTTQVPSNFVVHVSADSRYELFVNGRRVSYGPLKGRPTAWNYETLDIAPHLRQGKNTLGAWVLSFGPKIPGLGFESVAPAFLLDANQSQHIDLVSSS